MALFFKHLFNISALWAMVVRPPSWLPAFWAVFPLGVRTSLWDTRASMRSDVGIWLTFTAFPLISNEFSEVQVCAYSLYAVCMWRASPVLHGWQNQRKRRKENKTISRRRSPALSEVKRNRSQPHWGLEKECRSFILSIVKEGWDFNRES